GGRFNPEGIEPSTFSGWVRPLSVHGFIAADVGSNAERVERTYRDVRLDGADHYFAIFHVAGRSAMIHNDQTVRLDVGDVALIDVSQLTTFFALDAGESRNCVTLLLPRQPLVSHLGFEPQGGLHRRAGTMAGRLLFDLICGSGQTGESQDVRADLYLQL